MNKVETLRKSLMPIKISVASAERVLAALDRRAAEVRKPLVEALERIKKQVCGDKLPNWQDDYRTTNSRMWIADQCDDALTQCKEKE